MRVNLQSTLIFALDFYDFVLSGTLVWWFFPIKFYRQKNNYKQTNTNKLTNKQTQTNDIKTNEQIQTNIILTNPIYQISYRRIRNLDLRLSNINQSNLSNIIRTNRT